MLLGEAIERARQGDAAAFATIYDRYSAAIHRYAYRLLGDETFADDVTQETFLKAWQRLDQLQDDSRLEGWLYRIASNLGTDALRKRQRQKQVSLVEELEQSEHVQIGDSSGHVAEAELVGDVLRALPPDYAVCLTLRTVEGFSGEEIAGILGISKEAVWTRLSRARDMFAKQYRVLSRESLEQ